MQRSDHKLKIVQWNACGILNKKIEFENFLNANNVDICLLNETLLNQKNKSKLKILNYKIYRNDSGRGTAILIKNNIFHYEFPILNLVEVEATGIKIKIKNQLISVISVYNSPSNKFNKNDFDKIFNSSQIIFTAGDFNAKHRAWGSRIDDTVGKKIV